jgi:hypothetical protein
MVQSGRLLVSPTKADSAGDGGDGGENGGGEKTWPLQLGQPTLVQPVSRIWLRAPPGLGHAMPRMHGRCTLT